MTPIILNSAAEARGFLSAKGDTTQLADSSLASFIWAKYGAIVDPNARVVSPVTPAPAMPAPARADSVARVEYRTDVSLAPRFRDKRLDAYNAAHGIPLPGAPRDKRAEAFAASFDAPPASRFRDKRLDAHNAAHGLPLAPAPLPGAQRDRRKEAFEASFKGR